jgi:DNA replication protein DnaC
MRQNQRMNAHSVSAAENEFPINMELASCRWIKERQNILITGPTGVGKSYLACALGNKACREGYRTLYARLPRLLQELHIARGDGRYGKVLAGLARMDLLLIDDWGLVPLDDHGRRDILEILEDRHDVHSTIVTGQLPVSGWHEMIGDPTLADAILDRLVHNAYKIELKGESMRKTLKSLTQSGHSGT